MTVNIYHKELLHLAAMARAHGRLNTPDASVTLDNPLCGDRVTIDVTVANGRVAEIAQDVRACVLCQASVSILGAHATGESSMAISEISNTVAAMLRGEASAPDGKWSEFSAFEPVRQYNSRHRCVMLPFEALSKALAKALATAAD
ncbi:MAG: iron-sulfur cluster assembly scaffold protein [Sphingomonadales bacterium]